MLSGLSLPDGVWYTLPLKRRADAPTTMLAYLLLLSAVTQATPPDRVCVSSAQLDATLEESVADFNANRTDHGLLLLRTVLQTAETDDCVRYQAEALRRLALADSYAQSYSDAAAKLARALTLFRQVGDPSGELQALVQLGYVHILDNKRGGA